MLVVAVLALVVLAVAKPWAGTSPPPAPPPLPELTAAPSVAPTPSPAPATARATTPPNAGIAAIDWNALGAVLQPRDTWGIRTVVYRPDNTVREEWAPIQTSESDVRSAVNNADSYAVLSSDGTVAALGVTTPLGDLPLDVRVWRMGAGSAANTSDWLDLALAGSTPSGDPSTRLLRPSDESSDGTDWPAGEYQLDILLESGITHVHLWLLGHQGPIPVPAAAATVQDDALIGPSATPGGFIASGTTADPYLFSGLPASDTPHDEFDAWLGLHSNGAPWAPGLTDPPAPLIGTASRFGAVLPEGQSFVSARLKQIAPISADLGSGTLVNLGTSGGPRSKAVVIFHPADARAGFAPGSYRIDGVVQTATGRVKLSWDLPALSRTTSTESLLLAADRTWPNLASAGWTVLAPGHRLRVTPAQISHLPADPGADCRGGAIVGVRPWYLGIAHPGAAFDHVSAWPLTGFPAIVDTPVQVSQLVDGLATIRPIAGDWLTGRYAIVMTSKQTSKTVTVCVQ